MKMGRDIKFVIYQILYIFVICVIALKGADIDLTEVLDKGLADRLKRERDSLIALGLISPTAWDTNKKYTDADLELILRDYIKKDQFIAQNTHNEGGTTTRVESGNEPTVSSDNRGSDQGNTIKEENIDVKAPTPPEFIQYTMNSIKNNYNYELKIYGDNNLLSTIKPQESARLKINGEKEIKYEVKGKTGTTTTKEKQPPKIDIQKFIVDGPDASLRSIQGKVGYRVTIISNFAGDLDIKFSGPVKFDKVSSLKYDITFDFPIGNENSFDNWAKGRKEPFKESFTVTVKDKYDPKVKLSQLGIFTFGKW